MIALPFSPHCYQSLLGKQPSVPKKQVYSIPIPSLLTKPSSSPSRPSTLVFYLIQTIRCVNRNPAHPKTTLAFPSC